MDQPAPPSNDIDTILAELSDELDVLGDWEERYRYVIDLGKELPPLSDAERSDGKRCVAAPARFGW